MDKLILKCEIPGRVRPLKNSKQLIYIKGRSFIIPSKEYKAWLVTAKEHLMFAKGRSSFAFPYEDRIHVKVLAFYDHHPCDLDNALSSIAEALQAVCVVINDNLIASYDGSRILKCGRGQSRVEIEVYTLVYCKHIRDEGKDQAYYIIKEQIDG